MEVEIKIPLSLYQFSELLSRFGKGEFKIKNDYYFSKYNTYEERKEHNEKLIRIREEVDGDCFLTTKNKSIKDGVENNIELETKIDKGYFMKFFNDIGYLNYFSKNKKSWLLNIQGTNSELEIINNRYFYIEIEYITNMLESRESALLVIKQVCDVLGVNYEDRDERSWIEILKVE